MLSLALGGIGFAAHTLIYKPQGYFETLFAGQPVELKYRELPKPFEVYQFANSLIPKDQIVFTGETMKLDRMPSLTTPAFLPAKYATHVEPNDRVVGVTLNGMTRAYPVKILTYHEAINDRFGAEPLLITYCSLCDSAAVFDRVVDGREVEFGISGMLYNSNTLLYVRNDEKSLWSQLKSTAVTGPHSGVKLATRPVELTTWSDWLARYPQTMVLSKFNGLPRDYDYSINPLGKYADSEMLLFPVEPIDKRLPLKARVLAVWTDETARAYPVAAFESWKEPGELKQSIDGVDFTLLYDPKTESLRIAEAPDTLQRMYAMWFAWHAFHPQTELYAEAAK